MARLQPFSRSIEVLVNKLKSPQERSKAIARIHRAAVHEAEQQNAKALGAVPPSETWVDGRKTERLESVNPDRGVILTKFELLNEVLGFVAGIIEDWSPVLTGAYKQSHRLFADGVEFSDWRSAPPAKEYVIQSVLPYARKIERGQGSAPDDGVYEGAAALANGRFGNTAWVKFTFRGPEAEDYSAVALGGKKGGKTASAGKRAANAAHNAARYPAIVIRMK